MEDSTSHISDAASLLKSKRPSVAFSQHSNQTKTLGLTRHKKEGILQEIKT